MTPKKLEGLEPRRKAAGLSREELGALVGVGRTNVANWESGFCFPQAALLPQIAGALCCTIDDLYRAPDMHETEEAATDGEP